MERPENDCGSRKSVRLPDRGRSYPTGLRKSCRRMSRLSANNIAWIFYSGKPSAPACCAGQERARERYQTGAGSGCDAARFGQLHRPACLTSTGGSQPRREGPAQQDGFPNRSGHGSGPEGQEILWPDVEQAVCSICSRPQGPLLVQLADELAITPLYITGVEGLRGATLHILDRLIWRALRSHQSAHIEGGAAAPRYKLDVAPFAACMNIGRDSLLALAGIISRNAGVVLPQAGFYPTTRSCN